MSIINKYGFWMPLIKLNLLGKRSPLIVVFRITNKCDLKCSYCNLWNQKVKEIDKETVFSIIDQICKENMFICLSGGEPLLREDIDDILGYLVNKKKVFVNLNSNGSFVPEKIDLLKKIDNIAITLDGPKRIHDKLRGNGSYKKAIKAIEIVNEKNVPKTINMVLTRFNIDNIDYVLNIAREYDAKVFFCPVYDYFHYGDAKNLKPDDKRLRETMRYLLKQKAEGRNIGHSTPVLEHMLNWPDINPIKCFAGRGMFLITAEGNIHPCCVHKNSKDVSLINQRVHDAIYNVDIPKCNKCLDLNFMETNFILSLNYTAMNQSAFKKSIKKCE